MQWKRRLRAEIAFEKLSDKALGFAVMLGCGKRQERLYRHSPDECVGKHAKEFQYQLYLINNERPRPQPFGRNSVAF